MLRQSDGVFAVTAQDRYQSLMDGKGDRRDDQFPIDFKVLESPDYTVVAFGMKSREYAMTRESRLQGNFSSFLITDFTDQNCIGCLTHEGFQRGRVGYVELRVNGNLLDSRYDFFHRIFNSQNFAVGLHSHHQKRVQGSRFTGSGWAADYPQSLAPLGSLFNFVPLAVLDTKLFKTCQIILLRIEKAGCYCLSVNGRNH